MKKFLTVALAIAVISAFAVTPVLAAVSLNAGLTYGALTGLGTQDIQTGIMAIINVLLGFLGIVAIIIILYGGFTWLTSAGAEDKISQAKKIISSGIIGLIIIFISYAIATFVIESLITATGAPNQDSGTFGTNASIP